MDREPSSSVEFTERGQSVYDYAIGVSLFLVVVIGVLTFIPTAFGSFDDGGVVDEDDQIAADRVADYLVETAFHNDTVRSSHAPRLEVSCVLAFFNDTAGCQFEAGNPHAADAGTWSERPVNVTIKDNLGNSTSSPLCWNETRGQVNMTSGCAGAPDDVPLRNGSNANLNEEFVTSTRYARLGGTEVYVVVRTW